MNVAEKLTPHKKVLKISVLMLAVVLVVGGISRAVYNSRPYNAMMTNGERAVIKHMIEDNPVRSYVFALQYQVESLNEKTVSGEAFLGRCAYIQEQLERAKKLSPLKHDFTNPELESAAAEYDHAVSRAEVSAGKLIPSIRMMELLGKFGPHMQDYLAEFTGSVSALSGAQEELMVAAGYQMHKGTLVDRYTAFENPNLIFKMLIC